VFVEADRGAASLPISQGFSSSKRRCRAERPLWRSHDQFR
jgi:hypothetical protein